MSGRAPHNKGFRAGWAALHMGKSGISGETRSLGVSQVCFPQSQHLTTCLVFQKEKDVEYFETRAT